MQDSPESEGRHGLSRWKGYTLALLAAVCWATGGLSAKWLFSPLDDATRAWPVPPPGIEADPVVLAGTRALVASIVLLVYVVVWKRAHLVVRPRDLPFLVFFGVAGLAAMHVSYFQAISHTNVATAILLEYLAPVIVLVVSVVFLREKVTAALPLGVVMSVVGCALVVGAFSGPGVRISAPGLAWGLAAASFFALYSMMGKYAAPRFSPWTLLVWGLMTAAGFWLLYLGGPGSIVALVSRPTGAVVVAYMAVFATIVPFAAFLAALHHIDATRALIVSTLEPVVAAAVAFALFKESFSPLQLAGGVLVIAAIIVVQRYPGAPAIATELPPAP
ncbi:MAG: DMT family transporter [Coriobacteriia bacterium]